MTAAKNDAGRAAMGEALSAYVAATLGEHYARRILSRLKAKSAATTAMHTEAHAALIAAIGEHAGAKVRLDAAIVAHKGEP